MYSTCLAKTRTQSEFRPVTFLIAILEMLGCVASQSDSWRWQLSSKTAGTSHYQNRSTSIHQKKALGAWALSNDHLWSLRTPLLRKYITRIFPYIFQLNENYKLHVLELDDSRFFAKSSNGTFFWCAFVARSTSHSWERAVSFKNVNLPECSVMSAETNAACGLKNKATASRLCAAKT